MNSPNRRQFLSTAAAGALGAGLARAADPDDSVQESQRLPEPKIVLPTDGVPRPDRPKRLAAITTAYFKYSHADDIITKFIEGYGVVGRIHQPACQVVSMYIEQFPPSDIGRGMAARYKIPLFKTPGETLTLGTKELDVDGVLLIGEHGDYPVNRKGQVLYPRRRLFQEIVKVFRATGKSVPVYNDKHFSYSWADTRWMYDQSKELGFPMMAGSSVPVTWRRPALELKPGTKIENIVSVGPAGVEVIGFHILEVMQAFAERRKGGETGVRAVQCLDGPASWQAAKDGQWSRELFDKALAAIPEKKGRLDDKDKDATVFLVEYADGLRAASYVSPGHLVDWAIAVNVAGRAQPAATWCYMPKPQRDHFSFLCNHIEKMFLTGKPSYPVERTLLTTGMLAYLMDSRFENGRRIETPELAKIRYQIG